MSDKKKFVKSHRRENKSNANIDKNQISSI